ncbi:MAG: tetratricopeptide repeat protein, partial [Anaerolineales bacterium]|nr:tetratricopeptide repeat protein [Anaerolineales bacterium]
MSDRSTTDLVQQGLAAARVGDVEDARRLLQQAVEQTPANVEAWLGLAGVVESLAEKEACFNKALALDPANNEAKAGLALV